MSIKARLILIFGAFVLSAIALPSALDISTRQVTLDANGLPPNWYFLGCFTDNNPIIRTLHEASFVDPAMTPLLCTQLCSNTNGTPLYNFAGTEYSRECYCDYMIQSSPGKLLDSACTFACGGNGNQTCGGASKINIYQNLDRAAILALPVNKPTMAGGWSFLGCFSDGLNGKPRTLEVRLDVPSGVTAESCTARCASAGFSTAGMEYGQECWCGNNFDQTTKSRPGACSMTCKPDHKELCGAANYLTIYTRNVTV